MKSSTRERRSDDEIRPVSATPDLRTAGAGAVLFSMGETRLICAASVSRTVPDHAAAKGWGWITAEYTMLPYSTSPRTERRASRPDGRAVEIQRLVGRSLRSAADLAGLAGYAITVDCDVLKADGGTRTAAITGGFIALRMAVDGLRHGASSPWIRFNGPWPGLDGPGRREHASRSRLRRRLPRLGRHEYSDGRQV